MFSISGIQLREISDAASYLAPISEVDRAYKYPYDAPEGGFVLASGRLLNLEQAQLDQMDELEGFPNHYLRIVVPFVAKAANQIIEYCQAYIAHPNALGPGTPSNSYRKHLEAGYLRYFQR